MLDPFNSPIVSLERLLRRSCPEATAQQIRKTSRLKKKEADRNVPSEFMVLMNGYVASVQIISLL
jgi:hypothetical protein